jgi:pimeloyl-ACP methyl ester carboxylesterase
VARHVADLQELLAGEEDAPVLVGHSWGAMLALAYAAAHPGRARGLALIGCGTFDARSRALLEATVERRMDADVRRRLEVLGEIADPDLRLRRLGELMLPVYSCELAVDRLDMAGCDARAHEETWNDMRRLQEAGIYPASFAAIHVPILMLHGAADPHPGRRIEATLRPYLPQLEYREWGRCGHYPWLERNARDEFLAVLREWLLRKS